MELKDVREKIDLLDDKLTALFVERMELSKQVALIKEKEGLPISNVKRERDIIIEETSKMPEEIKSLGKQFYENVFSLSKAYQTRTVEENSEILNLIKKAISETEEFPQSASVACQGVFGAYSQIAADKLVDVCNITYFKDFDGVFSAVEKGFCRYGVLPIENSSVGSVNSVYDLMLKHKFYIVKAIKLRINHCLLAKKGVELSQVKEVFSHEKAIGQCSKLLKELGVKITVCENTAVAAKMVEKSDRLDVACISSLECASIYNLSVLKQNANDTDNNYTRFILISKKPEIYDEASKISVMVNLPHEAGSLNNILGRFSTLGLNLTKLESRPIPESSFEFAFYFDFEGRAKKREVSALLSELDNTCQKFVFLGNYTEITG